MTISIVGTGYVGLVTGAVFADLGNKVFCIDINAEKVENLKKGKIPFFESGLEELVKRSLESKRLKFTSDFESSISSSKVVFICVGTPPLEDGSVDLSQLYSATETTAKHLKGHTVVAIKSTVPIGIEVELEKIIKKNSRNHFEIVAVPEFLKEGTAIEDTLHPDRIVIGAKELDGKSVDLILDLHKHFSGERIICDLRSAQLVKYAANSLLATKVSFSNAVAQLSEKMGADVEKVLHGVGLDRRIGKTYLSPGVGYGGSCLPKDVLAFVDVAAKFGYDFGLLKEVDRVNRQQIDNFVKKIRNALGGTVEGKRIGILGLSFKPETDDIREAPSLKIIKLLLEQKAEITAYDPVAIPGVEKILGDQIKFGKDAYEVAQDADCLAVVTEWNEFRDLDFSKIKSLMRTPIIADGRNLYDPQLIKKLGFVYNGVGK
jgi:UDPglucose 6-dehydrogenase